MTSDILDHLMKSAEKCTDVEFADKALIARAEDAFEPGDGHAAYRIGLFDYCQEPDGGDYKSAWKWLQIGADANDAPSMRQLGEMVRDGEGHAKDSVEAIKLFTRASNLGDARAMDDLATIYSNGDGVAVDANKAISWYRKAADLGRAHAMVNLGIMYLGEQGVDKNLPESARLFAKAADLGLPWADREMGELYAEYGYAPGLDGKPDYAKARVWYQKGADGDDLESMWRLALLYRNGQGGKVDPGTARFWNQKAADRGVAIAMNNLGAIYDDGAGVDQDYEEAARWYRKAAEKGDGRSYSNIGYFYEFGLLGDRERDYSKAFENYRKSADLGDEAGLDHLGLLYMLGRGVAVDYDKARDLFEKARKKDASIGARDLGKLYLLGRGVPVDVEKARSLYDEAAKAGDEGAATALENFDFETVRVPLLEAIDKAEGEKQFIEAVRLRAELAKKTKDDEIRVGGKAARRTATAYGYLAHAALFSRDYHLALASAEASVALVPDLLWVQGYRAHALALLGRVDEASSLYFKTRFDAGSGEDALSWRNDVVNDLRALRKAGVTCDLFAQVEAMLGQI